MVANTQKRKTYCVKEGPLKTLSLSKNKELVLKAFDTLFNKRDYEAAEAFWSPKERLDDFRTFDWKNFKFISTCFTNKLSEIC